MSIPRSFDARLMVLLGGIESLSVPVVGAAVFTWLHDLRIEFPYWRLLLGITIVVLVVPFPPGLGGAARHHLGRVLKLQAAPPALPSTAARRACGASDLHRPWPLARPFGATRPRFGRPQPCWRGRPERGR